MAAEVPTGIDPEDQVAAKLAQSIKNSYMLVRAYEKAGYTPEKLANLPSSKMQLPDGQSIDAVDVPLDITYQLTPAEEKEVEKIINDVLATPAAQTRKLLSPKQAGFQGNIPTAPPGYSIAIFPNGHDTNSATDWKIRASEDITPGEENR